jgi:hypothetical protein
MVFSTLFVSGFRQVGWGFRNLLKLAWTLWITATLLVVLVGQSHLDAALAATMTDPDTVFQPDANPVDQAVGDNTRPSVENSADAGDIPSETVSRFVEAYLAVIDLIESQEARLQRAETDTESRQMQEEIQREAIKLIQDHGLSLQAYWELLGLANSDSEFKERVLAQVEEASL